MRLLLLFMVFGIGTEIFAQPINNRFADALLLAHQASWSSADAAYSNVDATLDGWSGSCGSISNNVWFKFLATTNEIDVRVLSGGSKGTLGQHILTLFDSNGTTITCNTDYVQSISITQGAWYYFSIDTSPAYSGTFSLVVDNNVGNDLKAGATELTDVSSWVSGDAVYSNLTATYDAWGAGSCSQGSSNVWFKFKATTTDIEINVQSEGSRGNLGMMFVALFSEGGSPVKCLGSYNDARIRSIDLTSGAWYYVMIASEPSNAGTFSLAINDAIGNDLMERAIVLSNIDSWTSPDASYSNVGTTFDSWSSTCGNISNNVWFKFQSVTNEIDIRVLTGGTKGTLGERLISLFDANGSSVQCTISTLRNSSLVPGAWYYLSIDSQSALAGTFTLYINDDLGFDTKKGAIEIEHITQWCTSDAEFTNAEAMSDGVNSGSCSAFNKNVWFRFRATANTVNVKLYTGAEKRNFDPSCDPSA